MKRNSNKNYTMYWFVGISGVLTIPAAIIIIKNMNAGSLMKTVAIMGTFLLLLLAIIILYKMIFGVSVQEITSEEKITELDRLDGKIEEFVRQYKNPQIINAINNAHGQIQKFKRRKGVLLHIAGADEEGEENDAITDIIQTVEDALIINTERLINRIEIFDDYGNPFVMRQNIEYINEQLSKNEDILMEFETLITETSRIGEVKAEKDISKLRDMVDAMQSLRTNSYDEMNDLKKKYEEEISNE